MHLTISPLINLAINNYIKISVKNISDLLHVSTNIHKGKEVI